MIRLLITFFVLSSCSNIPISYKDLPSTFYRAAVGYPEIIIDAKNALEWINKGKIIIKDTVNELGDYEYDDLRDQEEINQGEIEVIDLDKKEKKKGWKFWK